MTCFCLPPVRKFTTSNYLRTQYRIDTKQPFGFSHSFNLDSFYIWWLKTHSLQIKTLAPASVSLPSGRRPAVQRWLASRCEGTLRISDVLPFCISCEGSEVGVVRRVQLPLLARGCSCKATPHLLKKSLFFLLYKTLIFCSFTVAATYMCCLCDANAKWCECKQTWWSKSILDADNNWRNSVMVIAVA